MPTSELAGPEELDQDIAIDYTLHTSSEKICSKIIYQKYKEPICAMWYFYSRA